MGAPFLLPKPMLPAFLATVLFSLSAVSANRSTRFLGATTANLARLVVATVLLGLWAHTGGAGLAGAGTAWLIVSGCVGFGFGDLALFQALPRLGSRLTVLLVQCLAAPIGALAEWLWLGTGLSLGEIVCGLTILGGVATALAPEARNPRAEGDDGSLWERLRAGSWRRKAETRRPEDHRPALRRPFIGGALAGVLFGVLAAAGQAGGAVLSRKAYEVIAAAGQSVDGITAAYQRLIGGLAVATVGYVLVEQGKKLRAPLPAGLSNVPHSSHARWRAAWTWVLVNGISGPALGVSCYQWALETTPTGIVLAIVATTPLVVIPFAVKFEGERPKARSVIGGAVAVVGAIGLVLVA